MPWLELIPLARCRRNGGTFVAAADRELAVFLLDAPERVVVIDNSCPHAGGNLSGGEVKAGVVQCPWHQWEFDLERGVCTHSDLARVRRYPVQIRDGVIWADLNGNVSEPRASASGSAP
jgi:nitrite reductase/ring-hydroxylating ferredoxin subunit